MMLPAHNQVRKRAFRLIDDMMAENKPIELIIFTLENRYGLGERFVNNRLHTIQALKKRLEQDKAIISQKEGGGADPLLNAVNSEAAPPNL